MDSQQQGETEEKAEESATNEPKEAGGGGESEDAEKSSQHATSAEDTEDEEAKPDEGDTKEDGDKEVGSSEKGAAPTENTAQEGDDKKPEEKDKHEPSEKGEEQTEAKADKSAEKGEAAKKEKTGKHKSGKAGKQKKSHEDTEASTKKGGKAAAKSPPKEEKKKRKKGKKGAEAEVKEAPKVAEEEEELSKEDEEEEELSKEEEEEEELSKEDEETGTEKSPKSPPQEGAEAVEKESGEEEEEEPSKEGEETDTEKSPKSPPKEGKKKRKKGKKGAEAVEKEAPKEAEKEEEEPSKEKDEETGREKSPPKEGKKKRKKGKKGAEAVEKEAPEEEEDEEEEEPSKEKDEETGKEKAPKSPPKEEKKKRKKGKKEEEEPSKEKDKETGREKSLKSPPKEGKKKRKKGKKGAEAVEKKEEEPSKEKDEEKGTEKKSAEGEQEEGASRATSEEISSTVMKSEDELSSAASDVSRRTSSKLSSKRDRKTSKKTQIREPAEGEEPKEKGPFDIEGVIQLEISPELQEKLQCTIGEQVTAESPWTLVDKKPIYSDMRHRHSVFRHFHKEIKEYKEKEVLFGYQVAADIPNMFYVCITESAKAEVQEILKNIENEQKERVQKMMVRYAGEWKSLGSEKEIDSWKIELSRPLIEVDIQVSTKKERKPNIEDCDATVENGRYFKIGPSRVPPTNIERLRADEGVQACPETIFAYAQTYLPFPTNIWTQYLYEINEADIALSPELTQKLKEFMEHSYNMVQPVISYNSHFDLYIDDYVRLVQSQRDLAKSKEILYKSYNIFFDVYRCKHKLITACDWHPMWSGIVAVAYSEKLRSLCLQTKPHEAEDILTTMGSSPALIWSFVDEISPKLILECPHQIHALRFCPHDENLLIGGCENGQVVLWDLTDSLWHAEYEEVLTDDQKSYRIRLNKHMAWMKRVTFNNIIKTSVMSSLEFSPHACISDIRWLSPYAELTRLGRYQATKDGQKSLQFTTLSEDGVIYVWDLQAEVKGGPVKAPKKKRSVPEDLKVGLSKYKYLNLIFSPIFKIKVKDQTDTGVMRLTFMETDFFPLTYTLQTALVPNKVYTLSDRLLYTVSFQEPKDLPRRQLFIGTVEGHALCISWAGHETETGEAVSSEHCKFVSYNGSMHDCPVTSVSRSPFLPDLVLTVSARVFAIWREDFKDEPLIWRKSAVKMSCGRWSLYRPSSFLICNYDGSITTWDLLLRSNSHIKEQTISGKIITGANPIKKEPYQNIMAFNDFMGGFRVFTVPTAYMEYEEEDEEELRHFFDREINARNVFREWVKRWWEKNSYILEEEQAAREQMEKKLKAEADKQAKEDAIKALEMEEAKKHKKEEKKESWTVRYQKKWDEMQDSNMMKVIMTLKHFRKSELLNKLQPLEALQEEEAKKKLKYKERLEQAQKLFEDLIFILFQGILETPQSVHLSEEVIYSHLQEIPSRLLDVYKDLEKESLAYVKEHEFTYDFSWHSVLSEGLERREALDEHVCPREERINRFREERQTVVTLAYIQRMEAEEEEASELESEEDESEVPVFSPSEGEEEETLPAEADHEGNELQTEAKKGPEEETQSAAPQPPQKP